MGFNSGFKGFIYTYACCTVERYWPTPTYAQLGPRLTSAAAK